jgi:hypothetical protein
VVGSLWGDRGDGQTGDGGSTNEEYCETEACYEFGRLFAFPRDGQEGAGGGRGRSAYLTLWSNSDVGVFIDWVDEALVNPI